LYVIPAGRNALWDYGAVVAIIRRKKVVDLAA
jgi:hypothetical protein